MSQGVIAERYAQALFELGVESGNLAELAARVWEFAQVYAGNKELQKVLTSPVIEGAQRDAVLGEVARRVGVPDLGVKGLILMARRRRLGVLPALAERLVELADAKSGVVRAQVTTAAKMPESYYQALSQRLEAATNKKVVLERSEDPSLIGGAIARVGDSIIDSSLRGRFEEAERRLLVALSGAQAS